MQHDMLYLNLLISFYLSDIFQSVSDIVHIILLSEWKKVKLVLISNV